MRDFLFKQSTVLDDFHDIREVSRSSGGAVFSAHLKANGKIQRHKLNNQRYMLKERQVSELGRDKDIMNEVNLLRQTNHENVIKCEGINFTVYYCYCCQSSCHDNYYQYYFLNDYNCYYSYHHYRYYHH